MAASETESEDDLAFEDCEEVKPIDTPSYGRTTLPVQSRKGGYSLMTLITKAVGVDLTRMAMPVEINEPLSFLQRLAEYCESIDLIHTATTTQPHENVKRLELVSAFAVASLASNSSRVSKPFNPLLGETFQMDRPDLGFRFLAEQVSHHPPISAFHVIGAGKFEGEFTLSGSVAPSIGIIRQGLSLSVEAEPHGKYKLVLHKFDDETYEWNSAACRVHNVIKGGPMWLECRGQVLVTTQPPKSTSKMTDENFDQMCPCSKPACAPLTAKLDFLESSGIKTAHRMTGSILDSENHVIRTLGGRLNWAFWSSISTSRSPQSTRSSASNASSLSKSTPKLGSVGKSQTLSAAASSTAGGVDQQTPTSRKTRLSKLFGKGRTKEDSEGVNASLDLASSSNHSTSSPATFACSRCNPSNGVVAPTVSNVESNNLNVSSTLLHTSTSDGSLQVKGSTASSSSHNSSPQSESLAEQNGDVLPKDAFIIWKAPDRPAYCVDYYCFSLFAMVLNDPNDIKPLPDTPTPLTTPLLPTDSRRRGDIRALENGDLELARNEKKRLEEIQRRKRKEKEAAGDDSPFLPTWFNSTSSSSSSQSPHSSPNHYNDATESWVYNAMFWENLSLMTGEFLSKTCPDIYEPETSQETLS